MLQRTDVAMAIECADVPTPLCQGQAPLPYLGILKAAAILCRMPGVTLSQALSSPSPALLLTHVYLVQLQQVSTEAPGLIPHPETIPKVFRAAPADVEA